MADLQFNEDQGFAAPVTPTQSIFIRFAFKTGLVHTEQGAEYLLLGMAVAGIIISVFLFFISTGTQSKATPSSIEEAREFMQMVPPQR